MQQKYLLHFNLHLCGDSERRRVATVSSSSYSLFISFQIQSLTIMSWAGAYRVLAFELFFKDRLFCNRNIVNFSCSFHIIIDDNVLKRKSILLWVQNVRVTRSTFKIKSPGRPQSARTFGWWKTLKIVCVWWIEATLSRMSF